MSSRRARAIEYLLGKLPEPEAAAFEEQCFLDNELFEETAALENDLLDSYVRGDLPETERQQFEKGYLISPARRANLDFSRVLSGHLSTQTSTKNTAENKSASTFRSVQNWPARLAWAAMVLVAIAAFAWITIVNRRLHQDVDSMRAQQAEFQDQQQELRQQIASLEAQVRGTGSVNQQTANNPAILSLVLVPGMNRSGVAAPKLMMAPAPQVKLQLYLEHDDYSSYRASVENAQGQQIWEKKDLKSQAGAQGARTVAVEASSSILKSGDYLVKLAGRAANGNWEDVEDYRFQVVTASR
jgi:hypothetical protein